MKKLAKVIRHAGWVFYGRPAKFDPSTKEDAAWFVQTHKDPRP